VPAHYLTYALINVIAFMTTTDTLSTVFSALADPTRRAILEKLSQGSASVGEIAEPCDISLPAISRHLKVLEGAGLISREKSAQWRHCHLVAAPLEDAAGWVEQYRAFWEGQFDSLEDFLASHKEH
jgi:DNA-binding transcriptional ArsR family regulator